MFDLKFNDVSKRFFIREDDEKDAQSHPLKKKLRALRFRSREFWAVRNVSFEVQRGEALGIIGHNGAGKSTILKLLSNITLPTSGEITINGRLSSLIEVGSGFHPELTGRENIYLNGSILGMQRRDISRKLDSIVHFAGIQEFVDTPVKRFSSGMYVRLGFSIAAHLDPEILLLDEVLAVGDSAFQSKCIQRIEELKQGGTTIVFISHDLSAVEHLCDRVLLLQKGQIVGGGKPSEIIAQYQRLTINSGVLESLESQSDVDKSAKILSLSFSDINGEKNSSFRTGDALSARVDFNVYAPLNDVIFEILFYSPDLEVQCIFTTESDGKRISLNPGRGAVEFICSDLGLLSGVYYTDVIVKKQGALEPIYVQYQSTVLQVSPGKVTRGKFYLPHRWVLLESIQTTQTAQVDHTNDEVSSIL
jgi:ABC-type polysaccharide/polyol phosphate transport system ATPase subunit